MEGITILKLLSSSLNSKWEDIPEFSWFSPSKIPKRYFFVFTRLKFKEG